MLSLLDSSALLQSEYLRRSSANERKQKGQVFTPPEIARFMAGLFSEFPAEFRLLDPGAGIGILTAAVCDRYTRLRSPRRLEVHLFENEPGVIPLLEKTMRHCRDAMADSGHDFRYFIHAEDFIAAASPALNGRSLFGDPMDLGAFDGVVMNPPYFKVRKDSPHAKLMTKVVHGQPNAYAFFLTLAAKLLKAGGEMVSITPRSFCSGLYFRGFRRWFFSQVALDHIHLFGSRTDTFKESSVLQESVVTKVHRAEKQNLTVEVTTSLGRDLDDMERCSVAAARVLDNSVGDCVIRIPGGSDDQRVMQLVESFPVRFAELGLRISTGPVVLFRSTAYLLYELNGGPQVPLLLPHNVKPFKTTWPANKPKKPLALLACPGSAVLMLPARNYVLLKRFSAKEEKRRLTAGCLLRNQVPGEFIAFENHLNYVCHSERELSEPETFGLAALFNSTLLDRYFRTISGNTQVNATEIRTMNFPDMKTIARIGKQVRQNLEAHDEIVFAELGVEATLRQHLQGQVDRLPDDRFLPEIRVPLLYFGA